MRELVSYIENHANLVIALATIGNLLATAIIAWFTWSNRQLYRLEHSRTVSTTQQFAARVWRCLRDIAIARRIMEQFRASDPRIIARDIGSIDAIKHTITSCLVRINALLESSDAVVAPKVLLALQAAELILSSAVHVANDADRTQAWTPRHYDLHEKLRSAEVGLRNVYDILPSASRRMPSGADLVEEFDAALELINRNNARVSRPAGWPTTW